MLRIKFYPRKHPSHVQIAHRELSGGSQTVKNEKLLQDIIPKVGSFYDHLGYFQSPKFNIVILCQINIAYCITFGKICVLLFLRLMSQLM